MGTVPWGRRRKPDGRDRPLLLGRASESQALDRLVDAVRGGESRALVLRGEAGVGKSALLEHLMDRADGCHVLSAIGVQAEIELPFASLHQLCGPVLDRLADLPGPQHDALGTAFGLTAGDAPDRFLVGLAVLSLLSGAAEERPIVCVVDDAQWLDRASLQVLAFVARRLLAERIAVVFAVREPSEELEFQALPVLTVRGLNDGDARALLDSTVPGPLDERVRDRVLAETRGNPLALIELPQDLTAAELAGGFVRPDVRPLANRVEHSFVRRVEALPARTRRLLLLAAAEPIGDVTLLWRAAQRLGIGADAVTPAESSGLVEVGARVRFRHPLARSAAYRAGGLPDRREIHGALAEATDPRADPDRRAWHRASAAVGPDEAVAEELERSAGRAQGRGGIAAAAAFLARAAELTPDPARRGTRALVAAQAKFEAAAPDAADEFLAMAELGPLDELQRARSARLRAQIVFARRRGSEAPSMLLDAARRLESLDGGLARETYLESLGAAIFAGRLNRDGGVRDAAEAARAAPPGPRPPRPTDLLLDGVTSRFTQGYAPAIPPLMRALDAFRQEARRGDGAILGCLWSACPVAPEPIAPELWDYETWHELATRAVQLARDAGALNVLPIALVYRAGVHVHAGEFAAASALIEEADAITEATGNAPLRYTSLILAAWRGEEAPARARIEADTRDATIRGEGRAIGLAGYATAVLYNGLGRYDDALAGAQLACEYQDLGFFGWSLAELIEAGARSGANDVAAAALRSLEEQTSASGTEWALGIQARSRALLHDGQSADGLYREAIERLERSRIAVHAARAHLVYGEWLRRENRRLEARPRLRAAYEAFSRIGAAAFAERARHELLATGESAPARTVEAHEVLTAQEAQIARMAAERYTNPEIASRLFISPRTVEYHLRKVFTKLGISSRRQLAGALPARTRASSPG